MKKFKIGTYIKIIAGQKKNTNICLIHTKCIKNKALIFTKTKNLIISSSNFGYSSLQKLFLGQYLIITSLLKTPDKLKFISLFYKKEKILLLNKNCLYLYTLISKTKKVISNLIPINFPIVLIYNKENKY